VRFAFLCTIGLKEVTNNVMLNATSASDLVEYVCYVPMYDGLLYCHHGKRISYSGAP